MALKPLGDKVLVKPSPSEHKSGSLIIPDTVGSLKKGVAVAVGPGTKESPSVIQEGQPIMYKHGSGITVTLDNEVLLLLRENEIMLADQ